jgi:lipopolysaccharide/colanic/teichoic acid biosynthesis glycosyltransferase
MLAHNASPSETLIAEASMSQQSDIIKRSFDLLFSTLFAILAIPVIALAWSLVRLTSAGPGFYSQTRMGRNGRCYSIYKIRTMRHNCEASTGAAWCRNGDPRVTRIGRILRKLHIDELPQILNVLRGDMSLVGPRPERPEFVAPLSQQVQNYKDRLQVLPGVTGLAQIQLPPDQDVESVRKKIVLDRCYVQNRTLWLDLRIMVGTVIYLMGFSYQMVRKVMWLPNPLAEQGLTESIPSPHVVGPFKVFNLLQLQPTDSKQPGPNSIEGAPIACRESP